MRANLRGRLRDRDDQGMTLIELVVTSSVLLVLLGMVMISMDIVQKVSTGVQSQFQEFDQALPSMAPFHSLLGAEVEPAPPDVNGTPTPPYSSIGNFGLTFYANIGTGFNNTISCASGQCANGGTTAGPAMIQAVEVDGNGNPTTATSSCNAANPCSLQVRMYLPITGVTGPGVSTCPGVSATGTTCQYPTTYRLLANVQDVVNDPSNGGAGGPPTNPIFSYTLFDTDLNQTIKLTSAEVQNQTITGLSDGTTYVNPYPVDTQSLTACASAGADPNYPTIAIACPADAIQSVSIDLLIAKPGSGINGAVEDSLIVYRYAQSPGATTAPYQYSAAVG